MDTELGRAACDYVTRYGWPVLPCAPRGKVPLVEHGLHDATTDVDVVRAWWTATPDANIGVRTDEFVVVDADGPIGKHNWLQFIDGIGFESSPYAWSGGGGAHIWYRRDHHPVRNRAGWLDHVDIRSSGGYCIVPPSVHASGADYYWEHGPDERDVPPLPALLVDALTPKPPVYAPTPILRTGSKYAAVALDREIDNVRRATEGQRNDQLVRSAFSLGQLVGSGALDFDSVAGLLLAAACAVGLPEREATRTIVSGIQAGLAKPRSR